METLYVIVEVIGNLLAAYTAVLLGCIIIFGVVFTGVLYIFSYIMAALITQEEYEEDEDQPESN